MVHTDDTCMNQLPTETEVSFIITRYVSDMHTTEVSTTEVERVPTRTLISGSKVY
jgi:hypothetical protein